MGANSENRAGSDGRPMRLLGIRVATIAIIASGAHAVLFIGLHVLEPGLSPISSLIGDYAQTTHGVWATAAFIAFGVVWGAMAVALSVVAENRAVRVGRVLFFLAMIAILVAAVFPATADPRTGSTMARIQNLLARPGLFLGVLLVSVGVRRAPGWEAVGGILLWLSATAIVLLVATIGYMLEAGFGGVGQRAIFLILYAWVWTAARRASSVPKPSETTRVGG